MLWRFCPKIHDGDMRTCIFFIGLSVTTGGKCIGHHLYTIYGIIDIQFYGIIDIPFYGIIDIQFYGIIDI